MTIDERIEALTQSVELLASFHRDTEAAMQKLDEKLTEKIDALTEKIATNADNIAQISQLVLIHDRHIKEIESGQR